MTARSPLNGYPLEPRDQATHGIALDPRTHGTSRVPGRTEPSFDLIAFVQALEQRDTDYQLGCYAPDARIRIVDPDNPPATPSMVRGAAAIQSWLRDGKVRELGLRVTHQVDGGDRVAFTERWHYSDGTEGQGTSTAELHDGLITTQHTILVWGQVWP